MEEEGHTSSLCSQLGAVCGSQGDCHRQLDQPEQAKACYEESVLHLKACQSDGLEVNGLALHPGPTICTLARLRKQLVPADIKVALAGSAGRKHCLVVLANKCHLFETMQQFQALCMYVWQ